MQALIAVKPSEQMWESVDLARDREHFKEPHLDERSTERCLKIEIEAPIRSDPIVSSSIPENELELAWLLSDAPGT